MSSGSTAAADRVRSDRAFRDWLLSVLTVFLAFLGMGIGCAPRPFAKITNRPAVVHHVGPDFAPLTRTTCFETYFVKNTSRRGNFSNIEASTEKFVARMSIGLPAIHWERSIVW
jgi:hypothetical protein